MAHFSWPYFFTFIGGMLIVYWMVFVVAVWLKGFLSDQRVSNWMGSGPTVKGYVMGAATGAITPFCSCTTIPIFAGMIESDIKPGYAMSFLIASPTLNPPAILLFWVLFFTPFFSNLVILSLEFNTHVSSSFIIPIFPNVFIATVISKVHCPSGALP